MQWQCQECVFIHLFRRTFCICARTLIHVFGVFWHPCKSLRINKSSGSRQKPSFDHKAGGSIPDSRVCVSECPWAEGQVDYGSCRYFYPKLDHVILFSSQPRASRTHSGLWKLQIMYLTPVLPTGVQLISIQFILDSTITHYEFASEAFKICSQTTSLTFDLTSEQEKL